MQPQTDEKLVPYYQLANRYLAQSFHALPKLSAYITWRNQQGTYTNGVYEAWSLKYDLLAASAQPAPIQSANQQPASIQLVKQTSGTQTSAPPDPPKSTMFHPRVPPPRFQPGQSTHVTSCRRINNHPNTSRELICR
jgi:hypothetical protein